MIFKTYANKQISKEQHKLAVNNELWYQKGVVGIWGSVFFTNQALSVYDRERGTK